MATQGPAVELSLVIEGFDPVLENLLESLIPLFCASKAWSTAALYPRGYLSRSLRGILVAPRVSLVHCRPPIRPMIFPNLWGSMD